MKPIAAFFIALLAYALILTPAAVSAPSHQKWGPYTVVVKSTGKDMDNHKWAVLIEDRSGKVLREADGYDPITVEIDRKASQIAPLLAVILGDGGNDGIDQATYYTYSKSGVSNLFSVKGEARNFTFEPGAGPGHFRIIEQDIADLNEYDHFSRGGLGYILRIYDWDGKSYAETTSRYPSRTKAAFLKYQSVFLHSIPAAQKYLRGPFVDGHDDSEAQSHEDVMAPAVNYLANAIASGRTSEAMAYIHKHSNRSLQKWMQRQSQMLQKTVLEPTRRLTVNNKRVISADE